MIDNKVIETNIDVSIALTPQYNKGVEKAIMKDGMKFSIALKIFLGNAESSSSSTLIILERK